MIRFALALTLFATPAFAQSAFTTSAQAQAHCPGDIVVWLNTVNHSYRTPGERGYGRSGSSVYACQREAKAAGATLKILKPKATAPAGTLPSE